MNVLVIEDNEQNLYLVRYLLEARGHRVIEAVALFIMDHDIRIHNVGISW